MAIGNVLARFIPRQRTKWRNCNPNISIIIPDMCPNSNASNNCEVNIAPNEGFWSKNHNGQINRSVATIPILNIVDVQQLEQCIQRKEKKELMRSKQKYSLTAPNVPGNPRNETGKKAYR